MSLRDFFWWPNPLTYKGGPLCFVRDGARMYWRDLVRWHGIKTCEQSRGHDFHPLKAGPNEWQFFGPVEKCGHCGKLRD